ncbi:MAG: hypothetical protein V1755_08640 [Chloroflexota bacterium]
MPYIPGFAAEEPGPLRRFLPPLEDGTVAAWLTQHVAPSSWLLDPFGFSPRLPVEAARAGYRVLVTVNNPITRFLLELAVDPPLEADFKAALAELAASKRGDERLETHVQSLYLTRCQQCGRAIQATAFIWRKGQDAPFARIYECRECGDSGEREATGEDVERARKIAETDALHRSRVLERVATKDDPERSHVQEAIQHYLPRPLYVLNTIINRIESLDLPPARRRALTASVLVACDAGNTLWGHGERRPRPKQLSTSDVFREQNVWMVLEEAYSLWPESGAPVVYVAWPNKIPEAGGICTYEGRLKNLADEVRKEIPIAAVIGSVPRPNQAFWTFSALWAGWLWGRAAVEPYRMALRRRRYDWAWNATALHAAFTHLSELLALGTPFFGLLPEVEPPFMLSAMTAISAAGFDLKGLALRTEDDPVQFLWERGERLRREVQRPQLAALRQTMRDYLAARGEPASYLHMKSAALKFLAEEHMLRPSGQDLEPEMRATRLSIETALREDEGFMHHSTGESVEAGTWGLREWPASPSLADRAEVVTVNYLQNNPESLLLHIETEVFRELPGLFTPSLETMQAILNSYAEKVDLTWRLREEDKAARRQEDLHTISHIIETTGSRLKYKTRREGRWLLWEERGGLVLAFTVLASALVAQEIAANPFPMRQSILVVPGGRVGLIAHKAALQPALAEKLRDCKLVKFRWWRSLAEVKMLTRESFEEQFSSDPVERGEGQMMMF